MSDFIQGKDELAEFNILIAAVTLAAAVARADGKIHPSELNILTDVLSKQFGVMSAAAPAMASAGIESEINDEDIKHHCGVFIENSTIEEQERFMKILIGIANADLNIDPLEIECLQLIAGEFNINLGALMNSSK
jgi:uncharacterized tellurite resistance protein B-like protein